MRSVLMGTTLFPLKILLAKSASLGVCAVRGFLGKCSRSEFSLATRDIIILTSFAFYNGLNFRRALTKHSFCVIIHKHGKAVCEQARKKRGVAKLVSRQFRVSITVLGV